MMMKPHHDSSEDEPRGPTAGYRPGWTVARAVAVAAVALWAAVGPGARRASAQVSLADDIIIAAQGKENAERAEQNRLGRRPGTSESPYHRSPGTSDVVLGQAPSVRIQPLRRVAQRPARPTDVRAPTHARSELGHGLAPAIERLPVDLLTTGHLDSASHVGVGDEGPPGGLTLDEAINHMLHSNLDLRTKGREIPQAEADVLTAGLRENPLLFYATDGVPYGSYSEERPGDIEHAMSVIFPIDYTRKREARVGVAEREKELLQAQYQNAVREAIDDLAIAYIDVLSQRAAVHSAEQGVGLIDQLLNEAREGATDGAVNQALIDDLTIEQELARMSLGDEQSRYLRAKRKLGGLLELEPEQADALELLGALDDIGPELPDAQTLISLAVGKRPDLKAHQIGVQRAQAELKLQRANRFSDAYFLYSPFTVQDNSKVPGERSITTWGAGLFVSVPLFNRNQGNVKRAQLNIAQSQDEMALIQGEVIGEVRQAMEDYENTRQDAIRLRQTILPAIRRKRDRAWEQMHAGEVSPADFLAVQRDGTTLVSYYRENLARHRRNAWKLNTAVGHRVLP